MRNGFMDKEIEPPKDEGTMQLISDRAIYLGAIF